MPTPLRPRLRVSFWFEGEAAKCELVLMDQQRALVHRQTIDVEPGSGLERVQAGLLSVAGTLARAVEVARTGGAVVREPAAEQPVTARPPPAPQLSEEEFAAERLARAERSAAETAAAAELEPEAPPELEPEAEPTVTPEQLEQHAAERQRRAELAAARGWSADTLIENVEPPPASEPEAPPAPAEPE